MLHIQNFSGCFQASSQPQSCLKYLLALKRAKVDIQFVILCSLVVAVVVVVTSVIWMQFTITRQVICMFITGDAGVTFDMADGNI